MKKYFLTILLLAPGLAYADNVSDLMGLGMPAELASEVDAQYSSAVDTDQTFTGTAQSRYPAASVITPSVTYSASRGNLTARHNIIAAGAPTSAFVALPAATANVGKEIRLYNQGSNPVAIVPSSGVVNVSGALTPFVCTTLKQCQCTGLTTGVWGCSQQ